jgi:hypothetical protein
MFRNLLLLLFLLFLFPQVNCEKYENDNSAVFVATQNLCAHFLIFL